jgi:hypothetical protein
MTEMSAGIAMIDVVAPAIPEAAIVGPAAIVEGAIEIVIIARAVG